MKIFKWYTEIVCPGYGDPVARGLNRTNVQLPYGKAHFTEIYHYSIDCFGVFRASRTKVLLIVKMTHWC
jgi:hypothetical protein